MIARRGPGWVSVLLASSTAHCCSCTCSCTALAPLPALADAAARGVTRKHLVRFSAFLHHAACPHAFTSAILQQRVTRTASALPGERLKLDHAKVCFSYPLSSPVATAATRRLLLQSINTSSATGGTQRAPAACGGAWRAGPCSCTHGNNDHRPLSEE